MNNNGFTIIEILVAIAIFTIATTIVLVGYSEFSEKLFLKKTAQEIALLIHQARVYAFSVREFGDGNDEYPGYGVHFYIDTPKTVSIFGDIDNNKKKDDLEGIGEIYKSKYGYKIKEMCINKNTPDPNDNKCGIKYLDIVYLRPNPSVSITAYDDDESFDNNDDAEITIESPKAYKKIITIWKSGQISVE